MLLAVLVIVVAGLEFAAPLVLPFLFAALLALLAALLGPAPAPQ